VRRKIVAATETSEVHDLPNSGESGDVGEVRCSAAVENLEVTWATHRVDEVIGDLHAFEGGVERGTIQEIPFDDPGRRMNPTPHDLRPACQAAHVAARGFEATQEPTADVTGRASKQDGLFGVLWYRRLYILIVAVTGGHWRMAVEAPAAILTR
jgi:hypothetical protein